MKASRTSFSQDNSRGKPNSFIPKPGERFLDNLHPVNSARTNADVKKTAVAGANSSRHVQASPVQNGMPSTTAVPTTDTSPSVQFGSVDALSTPREMTQKRIPPRKTQAITYSVSNFSANNMGDIVISVENANGNNGMVSLNGQKTVQTNMTGVLNVKGTVITHDGNGGRLRLVATHNGEVIGTSNFFSVYPVPQNFKTKYIGLIEDPRFVGIQVYDTWESDSGVIEDLYYTKISEQVEPHSNTGVFAEESVQITSGYYSAKDFTIDSHGTSREGLNKPGKRSIEQTHTFKDSVTGAQDIPMKNSGYKITNEVKKQGSGPLQFIVTKTGAGTTAQGYSSQAGGGAPISKAQDI